MTGINGSNHRRHPPAAARGRDRQAAFVLARRVGIVLVPLAALLWCYWPTIVRLWKDWQASGEYSVGELVPLAALYLLWHDRQALRTCRLGPCWWGIALVLLAQAAWAAGMVFLFESAERYALVLTIIGLVLLIAGRQVFWRTKWILLFLFLMVPLPGRIHNMISGPMQTSAAGGAVFLLEAFGVTVTRHGNTLLLNHSIPLGVAEACSGLRMLTAFIVVAAVLAYVVERPRWQKAVVLVSSIPVAIGCNLLRLCVTAVLYILVSSEAAEKFFHDFAGLTMMPLAVLILAGELWLMNKLVIPDEAEPSRPSRGAAARANARQGRDHGKNGHGSGQGAAR